jgi:valyl-tRNA synthetase
MSQNKLNGNFAKNAPAEVVQQERDRLAESQQRIEKLEGYLKSL